MVKFKSFKQKEDELKASRINSHNMGSYSNEELYTINNRNFIEKKNEQKIKGQKHLNLFSTIILVLIHIIAITVNILLKEYTMIPTLIIGFILYIIIKKKIKIEYDISYRERLNNFRLTLKSVMNYFPLIVKITNNKDNYMLFSNMLILILPILMFWNGISYFFAFFYLSAIFINITITIIDFYNKDYFGIEKRISFTMNFIFINILILSISASAFYIVSIFIYIIYLFIYKFVRTLTDYYKERGLTLSEYN